MIAYIEYLNFPLRVAVVLIAIFFIMQLIGEMLEFKGKVVPEALKIRKYFARKKMERQTIQEVSATLAEVKNSLDDMNQHYRPVVPGVKATSEASGGAGSIFARAALNSDSLLV